MPKISFRTLSLFAEQQKSHGMHVASQARDLCFISDGERRNKQLNLYFEREPTV